MVFSSIEFVFMSFPAFLAIYYIIPAKFRSTWALLGSAAFFVYGMRSDPIHILFLVISLAVNYFLGVLISQEGGKRRKLLLAAGIIYNFARLILYKYTDTLIDAANWAFSTNIEHLGLTMPIGISFYVFCAVAYLVDVYRRTVDAERNVLKFSGYMLYFPKFISGPITRYADVKDELASPRLSFARFDDGLREFIVGLGLKVLIANQLGGVWNATGTIGYESISTPLAWFGIFSYSLQLYFDFYGYSLMAIGIGRMMGVELPKNFDHPYWSCSMTEFWRRWHMTLGSWFRDYVYIPLGGNRKGKLFTILNLLIVWIFTGIWHGAGGNFIIWGIFLFAVVAIEKLGFKKLLDRCKPLGHIYMLLLIPLSWLPFALEKLSNVGVYFTRLFPFFGEGVNVYAGDFAKYFTKFGIPFAAGLILCLPFARKIFDRYKDSVVVTVILVAVFWASMYFVYQGLNDPFMYFNF